MAGRRVLITGGTGFVGGHLVAALRAAGDEVHVLVEPGAAPPDGAIAHGGDVRDAAAVARAVEAARPDRVYHLAAVASVREASRDEALCRAVNIGGTEAVLEAIAHHAPSARVLVASSAEVYGRAAGEEPVAESVAPDPCTAYGRSKLEAERIAGRFADAGIATLCVRTFNLIGPGQRPAFVASDWARQLVQIELGRRPPRIETGNLDVVRDLGDVRDAVAVYRRLLEAEPRGRRGGDVVNVATGTGTPLRALLAALLAAAGLAGRVEVIRDPERIRAVDVPCLVGSTARLEARLGGAAAIGGRPLAESAAAVLAAWRSELAAG